MNIEVINARGLLSAIQEPLFLISTFILHMLLGPVKILSDRFGNQNILLLSSISPAHPSHEHFLDLEHLETLAFHLSINNIQSANELGIIKHFLRDKMKSIKAIKDVLVELAPMKEVFPATTALLRDVLYLPVSSSTCEHSFSNMRMVKTYCRKAMSDERLSDLTLLAVERNF